MPFDNPYSDLPPERVHRTSINIDKLLWGFLHSVHGKSGTLQTTCAILLVKLHNELKRNNITDWDPDRYESAVADATIVLGGCGRNPDDVRGVTAPINGPGQSAEAVGRDDSGGTRSVALPNPGRDDQPTNPSGAPTPRRKGKKGRSAA